MAHRNFAALGILALGMSLTIPLGAMAAEGRPAATPAASAEAAEAPPPTARDLPFTRENVLQVVRDHGEQLQGCYEDAMARRGATSKNAPAGRVVMGWARAGEEPSFSEAMCSTVGVAVSTSSRHTLPS